MTATRDAVVRSLTVITATVIALTFLFGFGNVLSLGLRLGVPAYVAPLVAPAVDLSVLGLLVGTRYLALHGGSREQLRPAQRLLMFASAVTLALNVAEPICAGQLGKAAFDAVGPLLLIGWAEVGPGLLKAIHEVHGPGKEAGFYSSPAVARDEETAPRTVAHRASGQSGDGTNVEVWAGAEDEDPLVVEACRLDTEHWDNHQRPISAETLGRKLRVGSRRARALARVVRRRHQPRPEALEAV
ncbi:hypothetical protein [Amycolatopsis taiwanensis]|uniref:DUF2637 domain-containing protein n=1 Tax=Amycolatopsis taiwanensis TaxID=342230 RepID=A0A9W6VLS8_9PSEU|nr:hypothetical protein [Amycolatopsis taiwanensis]GLY70821.1 hypothetical protein Atai01_74400 [Amycolatopsis taiwanensis]